MGGRSHIVNEWKYRMMKGEIFKEHPEHFNYFVSNYGRIQVRKSNFSKKYPGRITLGCRVRRAGKKEKYEFVCHLKTEIIDSNRKVHRLVAETWLPYPTIPTKDLVVDHIDGDSENNHAYNLQWMTSAQNVKKYHNGYK
jgi:hypothetical protein